jgi:F-type H+-transporting ATPase subunit b
MPQLDITTFIPQLFWLAVTFFVLYLLMKFLALPRVAAALAARRRRIDEDLAGAAALKSQAEAAFAAYEKSLATARAQAQALIRESGERLAAEAAQRHRELAQKLVLEAAAAEREIAAAKERSLAEIESLAPELAQTVAQKLTGSL